MVEIWDYTPPEKLDLREVWWRDHYDQLNNHGYLLRPRYSPQWTPSWKTTGEGWKDCEDGKRLRVRKISSCPWYLTICCSSLAKLLTRLEPQMEKRSL